MDKAAGGWCALSKGRAGLVVIAVLLAAGLWLLIRRALESGFHAREFWQSFAHTDPFWLGLAILLALASFYGRVLRWAVLMMPVKPKPSHLRLFSATAIGFTALVLFGRPGEFVRPYLIAKMENVSFSSQLAAWLLERVWDLMLVLILFGYALVFTHSNRALLGPALRWALDVGGYFVAIAGTLCFVALVALHLWADMLERRALQVLDLASASVRDRLRHVVTGVMNGVKSVGSLSAVSWILFYSLLEWALITGCNWSLFRAFPATCALGLTEVLVFSGFISFANAVQIPGIGGGVQIVSAVVLVELFRLPLETASAIALWIWVTGLLVIVPFGLVLAVKEGLSFANLKKVSQAAER